MELRFPSVGLASGSEIANHPARYKGLHSRIAVGVRVLRGTQGGLFSFRCVDVNRAAQDGDGRLSAKSSRANV